MMLSDLLNELQECLDVNGDREVMVAQQPTWPLAANVVQVWDPAFDDADLPGAENVSEQDAAVVWIATSEVTTSDRSPYAPGRAWAEVVR